MVDFFFFVMVGAEFFRWMPLTFLIVDTEFPRGFDIENLEMYCDGR